MSSREMLRASVLQLIDELEDDLPSSQRLYPEASIDLLYRIAAVDCNHIALADVEELRAYIAIEYGKEHNCR